MSHHFHDSSGKRSGQSLRSKKGMSLSELLVALLIGVLAIEIVIVTNVTSIKTFSLFRTRLFDSYTERIVSSHMTNKIHGAAYGKISADGKSLQLFDQSDALLSTYSVSGNDLHYLAASGASKVFSNVTVGSFVKVSPPAGDKAKEIMINFTSPVSTSVIARCRVDVVTCAECMVNVPGGAGDGYDMSMIIHTWSTVYNPGYINVFTGNSEWYRTLCFCLQPTFSMKSGGNPTGYVLVGYALTPTPKKTGVIFRIDLSGKLIWSRLFGDTDGDIAYSVIQTFDSLGAPSGYVAAGATNSTYPSDGYIVKFDENGNKLWTKYYGEGANTQETLYTLKQLFNAAGSEDGYICAGVTQPDPNTTSTNPSDGWVLRLDGNGNKLWSKAFVRDNKRDSFNTDVEVITDSVGNVTGYVFCGTTADFPVPGTVYGNCMVLSTDAMGNQQWLRFFHYMSTSCGAKAFIKTFNSRNGTHNGYMCVGTYPYGARTYGFAARIRLDGTVEWTKDGGSDTLMLTSVCQTFSSTGAATGYVWAGYVNYVGTTVTRRFFMTKTDLNGNTEWTRMYSKGYSDISSVHQIFDNSGVPSGFIFCGPTDVEQWGGYVVRTDIRGYCPEAMYPELDRTLVVDAGP